MKMRSLFVLALLAPAAALAAPASTYGSGGSGVELGGFIGYETADVSGLALRLDAEVPLTKLAPAVNLSFVPSFGYSHLTNSSFEGVDFTSNLFKFVGAARFTFQVAPQLDLFGDAGMGFALINATASFTAFDPVTATYYSASATQSSANFMMRFGAGAWYHVSPRFKLGGMLEFDPIFGDYSSGYSSQSTFNILFGAMYRM